MGKKEEKLTDKNTKEWREKEHIEDRAADHDAHEEVGEECSFAAELARLSGVEVDVESLAKLLALSDEELAAYSTDTETGGLSLESFLAPGGGWGGSETPVRRAIRVGQQSGLVVTSLKRSNGSTGSDHHTSQRLSFAADVSNGTRPTPQMLRVARQIAGALGYRWPDNGYLVTSVTSRGLRAQLIYNSSVVPNHENHVHFGVRKVRKQT